MRESEQPIAAKIGMIYHKTGPARFYSHHDLMRFFERAVRRAGLPVRLTRGFNPRPRLVFPQPRALGIISFCERIEIEFSRAVDLNDVGACLARFMLSGMAVDTVYDLPCIRRGQIVLRTFYRLDNFPAGCRMNSRLGNVVADINEMQNLPVDRHGKSGCRQVDIRRSLEKMTCNDLTVEFSIKENEKFPAKADDVRRLLSKQLDHDLAELEMTAVSNQMTDS